MRKSVEAAAGCWMILVIMCGCHFGSNGKILSQDTMKVVLMDILKADAYNEFLSAKDTNYRHDTAYALLYVNVFEAHHISRKQFNDSYDYYMSRPEELKTLVDSMANEANREMAKAPNGYHLTPGHPAPLPGHPFVPPGHPTGPQGHPFIPPGRPFVSPGHPTGRSGQPFVPGHPFVPPTHPATPVHGAGAPASGKPSSGKAPSGKLPSSGKPSPGTPSPATPVNH